MKRIDPEPQRTIRGQDMIIRIRQADFTMK